MPDHLIENEGRVLRVNGQRFHAVWLADNAPLQASAHPLPLAVPSQYHSSAHANTP